MSQNEKILQYCKDFGSISTLEAFRDLGITRLSARIWEIERSGKTISRAVETGKNRYGEPTRWLRYRIKEEKQ